MARRPPLSRGARVATVVGVLMVVGGLGLLGYVGWQLYGTNYVSQRQQEKVTRALVQQWKTRATAPAPAEPAKVRRGQATGLIRIPAFGKDYAVPVIEGISQKVLARGFGHFPGAAQAGEVGNYALAAHRVTHGEPLRRMPELRPGDKVIVETADARYVYELDTDPNELVISFTGVWVLQPVPKNPKPGGVEPAQQPGQRLITLTTCSELFHTDERMIAFGHLVRTVPKPAG